DQSVHGHRMFEEFARFAQAIHENDHAFVKERLAHSKLVMEVVEKALADAQIVLG
ncbi:gfo/Idh/MocA family oxidoreductase, partial [Enterococcus casseliflavus]|nr:gfo/Idh/MocA family oxidoreductase [Enterococcus casseliflavus]